VKTTVEIADSLFEEAKSVAKERGITLRELIEGGLRQSLRQRQALSTPFRLKDGSFKGKGLQKDFTWPEMRHAIYEGRGE
jgi:hypothetical protein